MLASTNSTISSKSSQMSSSDKPTSRSLRMLQDLSYMLESSHRLSNCGLINKWDILEDNINEWLDDQNIFMVDPSQKQMEFYQSAKNLAFEECQKEDLITTSNSSNSSNGTSKPSLLLTGRSSWPSLSISQPLIVSPQTGDLKFDQSAQSNQHQNPSIMQRRSRFSFSNLNNLN